MLSALLSSFTSPLPHLHRLLPSLYQSLFLPGFQFSLSFVGSNLAFLRLSFDFHASLVFPFCSNWHFPRHLYIPPCLYKLTLHLSLPTTLLAHNGLKRSLLIPLPLLLFCHNIERQQLKRQHRRDTYLELTTSNYSSESFA